MSVNPDVIRGDELVLDTCFAALQSVPTTATFACDGAIFTQPDLLKKIDTVRTPFKTVRADATSLKKARADLKAQRPGIKLFVKALETAMKGFLGEANPQIVTFGFKPNKTPRVLTTAEKAQKAAKARATRAKNLDMGKQQEKAFDQSAGSTPPPAPGNGKVST